jgi:hypothetical protein
VRRRANRPARLHKTVARRTSRTPRRRADSSPGTEASPHRLGSTKRIRRFVTQETGGRPLKKQWRPQFDRRPAITICVCAAKTSFCGSTPNRARMASAATPRVGFVVTAASSRVSRRRIAIRGALPFYLEVAGHGRGDECVGFSADREADHESAAIARTRPAAASAV